jgi:hypothetical protein
LSIEVTNSHNGYAPQAKKKPEKLYQYIDSRGEEFLKEHEISKTKELENKQDF